MAVPEPAFGIVRVGRIITVSMVAQVVCRPFGPGVLKSPASGD